MAWHPYHVMVGAHFKKLIKDKKIKSVKLKLNGKLRF